MSRFFIIGAVINLVALAGFIYWAVKAWRRADPRRRQEKPDEND